MDKESNMYWMTIDMLESLKTVSQMEKGYFIFLKEESILIINKLILI